MCTIVTDLSTSTYTYLFYLMILKRESINSYNVHMFTSTGKKIHISEATHRALKKFGDYITELRGEMPIKVHAWLFPMFTVIKFMFWFVVSSIKQSRVLVIVTICTNARAYWVYRSYAGERTIGITKLHSVQAV